MKESSGVQSAEKRTLSMSSSNGHNQHSSRSLKKVASTFGLSHDDDKRYFNDYKKEEHGKNSPGVGQYNYDDSHFTIQNLPDRKFPKQPRKNEVFNGKARAPGVGEYNIDISSFKMKPTSSNKHGSPQAPKLNSLKLCKYLCVNFFSQRLESEADFTWVNLLTSLTLLLLL